MTLHDLPKQERYSIINAASAWCSKHVVPLNIDNYLTPELELLCLKGEFKLLTQLIEKRNAFIESGGQVPPNAVEPCYPGTLCFEVEHVQRKGASK